MTSYVATVRRMCAKNGGVEYALKVRGGGDTITDINQRERERYAISVA